MIKIWLKFSPPQKKQQMLRSQFLYKFEKRICKDFELH